MRRALVSVLGIAGLSFIAVTASGFYPVAMTEGSTILARTWKNAERAAIRFTNAQLVSRGEQPIDFTLAQYRAAFLDVKRDTLTFLIEDAILARAGRGIAADFDRVSRERVEEALRTADLERGVKLLYGFTLNEFRSLVLLPQTRRDITREVLAERNQDFDEWFREVKRSERVRLLFTPFRWNGERVE